MLFIPLRTYDKTKSFQWCMKNMMVMTLLWPFHDDVGVAMFSSNQITPWSNFPYCFCCCTKNGVLRTKQGVLFCRSSQGSEFRQKRKSNPSSLKTLESCLLFERVILCPQARVEGRPMPTNVSNCFSVLSLYRENSPENIDHPSSIFASKCSTEYHDVTFCAK